MTIQQFKDEINKEFDKRWNTCCWSEKDGLHPEGFLIRGSEEGESDSYDDDKIKKFIMSLITKAYEEGEKSNS